MVCNQFKQRGFTLQELILGIALFFILSGIGVPSYISYARNGSRDTTVTELYSDIYLARSEAIKRKTPVGLCRTSDTTVANPACGGNANDWSSGWLVFVDNNNDGVYNGADTLLKVGNPANNKIQIKANSKANAAIQYISDGSLNTVYATAVFAICDDRDNNGSYDTQYGRDISVSAMGRPEITSGITTCSP
jgi:type IV fimbrial biogenesis protein FimT